MTTFLTFAVQALNFNSFLPVQSLYIPLIIIYFVCSIVITGISFVWFVLQNYLLGKGSLPEWVEKIAAIVKKILFFSFAKSQSKADRTKNQIKPVKENSTVFKVNLPNTVQTVSTPEVLEPFNKPCNKCEMCSKCKQDKEKESKKKDEKKKFDEDVSAINLLFLITTFILLVILNVTIWALNVAYQNSF